jgi:CRP/FNR family transcriptional regulator, cyclic AMP receptor protein
MTSNASGRTGSTGTLPQHEFDYQSFIARNPEAAITEYSSNQIVYAQGDRATSLYYLITGHVKISVVSEQGKEGVIALLGARTFFGEGCLDGPPLHATTVTATATEACTVVRLPAETVSRAMIDDPVFSRMFFKFLVGRTEKLKSDLIDQLFNSSEKRLARILLTLSNAGIESQSNAIPFQINQEVLANMVGTTRSRINQFMNKFRKLGYIEYGDRIKVHNSLINIVLND